MKKQKRYKICRGLFFLVFLLAIGTRLAFWGMAAEKESAETQTGAAGAYYEEDAFTVLLETEYAEKKVSLKEAFHWCPEYLQGLRVKEVELSPGLYLTEEDPGDFTGERANGQFRVCLEINDSGKELLTEDGCPGNWWIQEEETVDLNMILEFSKALTDSERERYIDVTLGNDQVTLKRRIWLVCKVIPVSFSGSGILPGSCYQLRSAEAEKNKKAVIDGASSFTAFYHVRSFIPGNYDSRKIVWKKDGMEEGLPVGTSIIMTERSEERSTTDFWYYKVQEKVSRIDLNEFTRMSGDEEYSYDMESTEYNSLDYQFMADFEESEEKAEEGLYQLGFIASDSSEEVKVCQMELEVQVVPGKTYDLEIRESEEREETPKVTVTCKTEDPTVIITCKTEDPREEIAQKEKTFALVLTGTGETELPEDARLKVGKREYRTSGKDSFILPLGDMQNENSNWEFTLLSDLFPEEEKEYHFTAQLCRTDPFTESGILKGKTVTEPQTVVFRKAQKDITGLKITGVRISDSEGWRKGQSFNVQVLNMPPEGQITVTAYEGLTGWQRSDAWNVSMEEGKISNACASKGTFRLIFEIKNAAGEVVCLAPYYLIVK